MLVSGSWTPGAFVLLISGHKRGAELEVHQLGPELVPVWDAGAAGNDFT